MHKIRARDENGDVVVEGTLNRAELAYLIELAIQVIIDGQGSFNLDHPDDGTVRFTFPNDLHTLQ